MEKKAVAILCSGGPAPGINTVISSVAKVFLSDDYRVIGINSLIFSRTGGNEGIGFAIPMDTVRKVAAQLIETGKATHPYIGIIGTTLDEIYAKEHNLKLDYGAVIAEVLQSSPANEVGLKQGDIITKFGDDEIKDMFVFYCPRCGEETLHYDEIEGETLNEIMKCKGCDFSLDF